MRVQEDGAARGETVHVRRLRKRMSAERADPVVLIVYGDEEDVWLGRGLKLSEQEERERKEEAFHFTAAG